MASSSPLLINLGPGLSMAFGLPTLASWENASRPKKPKNGTIGFNSETNSLEYWDGSDWYIAAMSVI